MQLYNILLIERDYELAAQISSWFNNKAQIMHVMDSVSAKEQASLSQWDLIITDSNFPEINDLDITHIAKQANAATSVLIVTENKKVDFIISAMQFHADSLFFKPLNKEEFVKKAFQLAQETHEKRKKNKIILAIGAHPDDVEFGCAGTLAKHYQEGHSIHILTLSSGEVGGDANLRREEAKNAARIQGAKLHLGDMTDTEIKTTIKTIQFIENIVEQINPTHIYTHSYADSHQDHRNVYKSTITACRQIPNVFSYFSPSSTVDFRPNFFINIDDFFNIKVKIIEVFKSQSDIRPYLKPAMIEAIARYWGRFCNYHLVEPMEMVRAEPA